MDGVTVKHIWDGSVISAELDDQGVVISLYLRGINLIASTENTDLSYFLFNAHGDVIQILDDIGQILREYEYDAFGNERDPDLGDANPWRYCGEYYDSETGTYYLRARYYDARVARFTTADTHWNVGNMIYGDDPLYLNGYTYLPNVYAIRQGGNLYSYCLNNPIRFLDPSGYEIVFADRVTQRDAPGYMSQADYNKAMAEYFRAIEYLSRSAVFRDLYQKLQTAEEIFVIAFVDDSRHGFVWGKGKQTIYWDPTSGGLLVDGISVQSAALCLAHEMGHAALYLDERALYDGYANAKSDNEKVRLRDIIEGAILYNYETPIAKFLGEPTRARYGDGIGSVRMNNSIHYRKVLSYHWGQFWNLGKTYTLDYNIMPGLPPLFSGNSGPIIGPAVPSIPGSLW